MRYVQLGHSGLRVSQLILGCMSYGSPEWRPWVLDEQAAQPFFERAIESGVNFFDTADIYSVGLSEQLTGRALKRLTRRDEIVIASKVCLPMGSGPNLSGLSRKHVIEGCEASLVRLNIETIDLYQIHRFDPTTPIEETLEALNDLVRSGKVRYIGASSGTAWRMALMLSASERRGWARFISMQNHYNLLYREDEREMIPLCQHEGVGLIPWSPLARGLLSRPTPVDRDVRAGGTSRATSDQLSPTLYDHPNDWDVVDAVEAVARRRGLSMAEVALAWVRGRPGVCSTLVGATKLAHLDAAIKSLDVTLTDEEVAVLEAPYRPHGVKGYSA
jgi:1-deoxyxylulose-5-phosphate synthase